METLPAYDAASNPCPTAAKWLRMVGVVVSTNVNHERAGTDIVQFQSRREHRIGRFPVAKYDQARQVAQVSVAPRCTVTLGSRRIVVTPSGQSRDRLAVPHLGFTTAIFMHVKAMDTGWKAFDLGCKEQAKAGFRDRYRADAPERSGFIDGIDGDRDLGGMRCQTKQERRNEDCETDVHVDSLLSGNRPWFLSVGKVSAQPHAMAAGRCMSAGAKG